MKKVIVKTEDLVKVMKENRDLHRDTFKQAQVVYRERAIEELDRMLADARRGNKVRLFVSLPEPEDHSEDYNRVIKMLEMHTEPTVELDEREAAQYVMDDWGWKAVWNNSTAAYVATT